MNLHTGESIIGASYQRVSFLLILEKFEEWFEITSRNKWTGTIGKRIASVSN
jgi:hypothetical protein